MVLLSSLTILGLSCKKETPAAPEPIVDSVVHGMNESLLINTDSWQVTAAKTITLLSYNEPGSKVILPDEGNIFVQVFFNINSADKINVNRYKLAITGVQADGTEAKYTHKTTDETKYASFYEPNHNSLAGDALASPALFESIFEIKKDLLQPKLIITYSNTGEASIIKTVSLDLQPDLENDVARHMQDLMAGLNGTSETLQNLLTQFAAPETDRVKMADKTFTKATIIATNNINDKKCYTTNFDGEVNVLEYHICWQDGNIVSIADYGIYTSNK